MSSVEKNIKVAEAYVCMTIQALMLMVWEILIHLRIGEIAGDSGALTRTLIASKELLQAFQPELTLIHYAQGGLSAVETELDHRYIEELETQAVVRYLDTVYADSDHSD